jgi:hypothetical protein
MKEAPMEGISSTALIKLDQACRMLAEAKSVAEVKDFRDKAEAVAMYQKQKKLSLEAQNDASEMKVRAEAKLGELLKETGVSAGRPKKLSRATTILPNGITRDQSSKWQKMASVAPEALEHYFGEMRQQEKEITSAGVLALTRPPKPKKPRKTPKLSVNGELEKDDADASGQLLDSLKQPVPPGLASVFSKVKDFRTIVNGINNLKRLAKEISQSPGGRRLRLQQFEIDMENAKRTVRFDMPYAVCPVCRGDARTRKEKCPCLHTGWLNESSYESCLPKEHKK